MTHVTAAGLEDWLQHALHALDSGQHGDCGACTRLLRTAEPDAPTPVFFETVAATGYTTLPSGGDR